MTRTEIDYLRALTTGEFGPFVIGGSWKAVESRLGKCEAYGVGRWGIGFGSYGCFEFSVRGDEISTIKLRLTSPHLDDADAEEALEIPESINMKNFERPRLSIVETEVLLSEANVNWGRLELLCDDRTTYYQTSAGVHILFEDGEIATVVAQGIFDGMIE